MIKSVNFDKPIHPYSIIFQGEQDIEIIDDKIVINPFSDFALTENSLTQEDRSYPVDFAYKRSWEIKTNINLPEGYRLAGSRNKVEVPSRLGDFTLEVVEKDNQVIAISNYSLNKAIYQPKDYRTLKAFLDRIVREHSKSIVLEKED